MGRTVFPVSSRQLVPRKEESECVASLEYDIEEEQLTVNFVKRGSYVYYDFPPEEFANFNGSSQRGAYFNLYIRDKYSFERL